MLSFKVRSTVILTFLFTSSAFEVMRDFGSALVTTMHVCIVFAFNHNGKKSNASDFLGYVLSFAWEIALELTVDSAFLFDNSLVLV